MRCLVSAFGCSLLVSLAGCFPGLEIAGASIGCDSDDDCPDVLVCDPIDGLCVVTPVERDVPGITEVRIDPATPRGPGEASAVHFQTSEPVLTPRVFYERIDDDGELVANDLFVVADEAAADGTAFVATVTVGASDVSGAYDLQAVLEDLVGNQARVRLRQTVVFDLTAPAPVSAALTVTPNAVDNPIFPATPTAVRNGSAAHVSVVFDEALAGTVIARLQQGDRQLDSRDLNGGGVVDFDFDAVSLAGVGFDDGPCEVRILGADARGNLVDVVVSDLLAGGFVIDNTPPVPPVFSRLVRAPWQSRQTDFTSEAFAVADDAVLVLVLTNDIEVTPGEVPLHVARIQPDPGTNEVHARLPVDVDGMQLVAVDAAGNMSVAVSAARTEVVATILAPTSPHHMSERPALRRALLQQGDRPIEEALRTTTVTTTAQPFWRPLTTVRQDAFGQPLLSWDPMRGSFLLLSNGETFHVDGAQVIKDDVPRLPVIEEGALALDVARGRIVLFGGFGTGQVSTNELWEWDGASWTQRLQRNPAATDRPTPRVSHAMAYVPALGGVVVVNGCGGFSFIELCETLAALETWLWDGDRFSLLCRGDGCGDPPGEAGVAGDIPPSQSPGLAVDDEGRLISVGGRENTDLDVVTGEPVVRVFDGAHWTRECADTCALSLPAMTGTLFVPTPFASRPGGGDPVAFGTCAGLPCIARYRREHFDVTLLDVDSDGTPGARVSLAIDPDGTPTLASQNIHRIMAGRLDRVVPSNTGARCGGAAFAIDDDTIALEGGCSECSVGLGEVGDVRCTPGDGQRRIVGPGGVRDERRAIADAAFGVRLGAANDEVVIVGGFDGNGQQTIGTRRANIPSPITLVPGLVPLLAFRDPASPDRAVLAWSTAGLPATRSNRVDAINADGILSSVCTSDCGARTFEIEGVAAAAGDTFAVVFGGSSTDTSVADRTAVFDNGVFVAHNRAVRPPPRRFAGLAHDPQRDVAWLFGGTSSHRRVNSKDAFHCTGGVSPADCDDVWAFDGDRWTRVFPFDPDGLQAPVGRVLAGTVGVAGGLIVAGGGPTDAWRLEADARLAPAALMQVSLAAMGNDAASGDLVALDVSFCGVGSDAARATVDVGFSAWAGDRFIAFTASNDPANAGCRLGHLDVTTAIAAGLERGERDVTVVAFPEVTAAATGAGFATLSTSRFEVRAAFARRLP